MSNTAANAHDVTEAHNLLHGGEKVVWCDAGYQGVHKRAENLGREVDWQVAMRPGKRRKQPGSDEAVAEKEKASVRAKVEHPFLKVKRIFDYGQVGWRKHAATGIVAGPRQPDDSGGSTGGLTWRPAGPNLSVGRLRARYSPARDAHRAKPSVVRARDASQQESRPKNQKTGRTPLVQSIPRSLAGKPLPGFALRH